MLFLDKTDNTIATIREYDTDFRDISRYIPLGVALKKSKDAVMFLTPYFFIREINVNTFKNSSKLLKLISDDIRKECNDFFPNKLVFKELKFFLPGEAEIMLFDALDTREIMNGIDTLQNYTNWTSAVNIKEQLLTGNIPFISANKKEINFIIGGIYANFAANYLMYDEEYYNSFKIDKYEQMSYDEFMANSESPKIVYVADEENEKKDEEKKRYTNCNLIHSLDSLKETFPNIELMDICVVPFGVLKLS